MKTSKRILAVLLTVLMAVSVMVVATVPASAEYKVGDTIQFGTYPQTKVDFSSLPYPDNRKFQNTIDAVTWMSYDYYFGYGELDERVTVGKYVQFADFFFNGNKYRAVKFPRYRVTYTYQAPGAANSYQDDNGYTTDVTYYFKYEPLTWRVLDPSAGFVMCENVIDSQAYQNTILKIGEEYYKTGSSTVYANNYKESSIRAWLNDHFYNTAFTNAQKAVIKSTTIDNSALTDYSKYNSASTTDKIFLLSNSDARNSDYGFSSNTRKAKGTDYAKCQGLEPASSSGYCVWVLRTAGCGSQYAAYATPTAMTLDADVNKTSYGIRPACQLSDLTSNTTVNPGLYSAGNKVVEITVSANPAEGGTVSGGGTYAYDKPVTVTATPNAGYVFEGWYGTYKKNNGETVTEQMSTNANLSYTFNPTRDIQMTAQFKKNTYIVVLYATELMRQITNKGGTVTGSGTYEQGKQVTITATPAEGYVFDGWYVVHPVDNKLMTKKYDNATQVITVNENECLAALFNKSATPPVQPKIDIKNFTANKTIDYRTTITFTAAVANPVDGAAVHWFVDGADAGTGETYTVKEAKKNFSVQAKYVKGSETLAESGVETVKVNSGFFAKLKAFFRGLFGKLPVIVQEYLGGERIERMLGE